MTKGLRTTSLSTGTVGAADAVPSGDGSEVTRLGWTVDGSEARLVSPWQALRMYRVWLWFGKQDIRSRYRGSVLGPLWLVLNLGVLVAALSVIYSSILGLAPEKYVPYLATGFLVWWLVSGVLTDVCRAFTDNLGLIRNVPLPLGVYVLRVVARHVFLLMHNLAVYVVVAVAYAIPVGWETLTVVPATILVLSLLYAIGTVLAIVSARFRDVPHIVASIVQLAIFVTPIVFMKDMLGRHVLVADLNPFYHMVEAIRAPLLGGIPDVGTWFFLLAGNVTAWAAAIGALRRWGKEVAFLL